jgi:hypothetical protein
MIKHKKSQAGFSHHFLLPLIAILAVGAIGWWLTFGSKAATPSPAPKQGWVDDGAYVSKNPTVNPSHARDYNGATNKYAFAVTKAGLRHTVLNVGVGELVNVNKTWPYETTYNAGSIESRIAQVTKWNKEHPRQKITVHLRFHVGKSAPQAWKDLCGTVTMKDGSFGVSADAPRWWVTDVAGNYTYRQLYKNAMVALAGAVSTVNAAEPTKDAIGSVNVPGAAPNYPEPMIIYANDHTERVKDKKTGRWVTVVGTNENLRAAGFTAEEHNSFMLWFPTVAKHFKGVAIELAVNPYQNIKADGSLDGSTSTKYKEVAQALIDTVHSRAVIANYSARESYFDPKIKTTNAYKQMYVWMVQTKKDQNVWIGLQLARPPRVASTFAPKVTSDNSEKWDDVARWAARKGFNFVETTGPKVSLLVGGITQTGRANIWPEAYHDDADDIESMQTINAALIANVHP